jgi:hypothetical protein
MLNPVLISIGVLNIVDFNLDPRVTPGIRISESMRHRAKTGVHTVETLDFD